MGNLRIYFEKILSKMSTGSSPTMIDATPNKRRRWGRGDFNESANRIRDKVPRELRESRTVPITISIERPDRNPPAIRQEIRTGDGGQIHATVEKEIVKFQIAPKYT